MTAAVLPHDVAEKVLRELSMVWDRVGVLEEERQKHISELSEKVSAIFYAKLKEEEAKQVSLESDIEQTIKQISKLEAAVGSSSRFDATLDGLTLVDRRAALCEQVSKLMGVREERLAELKSLLSELQGLWTALGGPIDADDTARYGSISEDLVTEDRILSYKAAITEASAERQKRLAEAKDLERDIRDLRALLCVDRESLTPAETDAALNNLPTTLAALSAQRTTLQWLRCEREARELRIKELARQITPLWDLLGVSMEQRQAFFETNAGLGTEVLAACEQELERLKKQKQERMQSMIDAASQQLEETWLALRSGCPVPDCVPAGAEAVSDQTLYAIQAFIKKTEALVAESKPVLKLIDARSEILEHKREYEEIIADKDRLLARTADARRKLERENLLRKEIEKKLPKIDAQLRDVLEKWRADHDSPFVFEGIDYLESMDNDAMEQRRLKEDARAKKEAEKIKRLESDASLSKTAEKERPKSAAVQRRESVDATATTAAAVKGAMAPPAPMTRPQTAKAGSQTAPKTPRRGESPALSATAPVTPRTPRSSATTTLAAAQQQAAARVPLSPRNQTGSAQRKLAFKEPAPRTPAEGAVAGAENSTVAH